MMLTANMQPVHDTTALDAERHLGDRVLRNRVGDRVLGNRVYRVLGNRVLRDRVLGNRVLGIGC
ncbi:hypothetical protein C0Q70_02080 [Pomacea canaliculata]|uniref:Uncharacterized protein n=1 Tax=Pomacea canaliculata TaxID=400727 RepID=A0A2T7Q1A7_POMCA|nr:hypothetical protein C0Q70_02080 [Pomacea canaliculata]